MVYFTSLPSLYEDRCLPWLGCHFGGGALLVGGGSARLRCIPLRGKWVFNQFAACRLLRGSVCLPQLVGGISEEGLYTPLVVCSV